MNNLVSVDIDICFNGHTFRDYMTEDLTPETMWKVIEVIKQEDKKVDTEVDLDTLGKIIEVLKNSCTPNTKVRIIQEHDEIIDVMKEYNCKDTTVYNFDAHHDIDYGEDNSKLNIENWVLHGINSGIIREYNWFHRPLSDMCCCSPIRFDRCCIKDLDISSIPETDLVVICVSHYFTPIKYWDSIPNVLVEAVRGSSASFLEVTPTTIDLSRLEGLGDLLADGTMPDIYRLFRNKDSWVIAELCEDNGIALSMVSFDNGNIWKYKEVVDQMIDEYSYVEFNWVVGIRNEKFIKRLAKNYNILISRDGYIKIGGNK